MTNTCIDIICSYENFIQYIDPAENDFALLNLMSIFREQNATNNLRVYDRKPKLPNPLLLLNSGQSLLA